MKLIIIGTDHRLQYSVAKDGDTGAWVPREGPRYRRLIAYCIDKLNAKAIAEEAHTDQEQIAPTIASKMAKERGMIWKGLGFGQPGLPDVLFDPPFLEAFRLKVPPYILAGRYDLGTHAVRERLMFDAITQLMRDYSCVLAIVGFTHLGILARMFEAEKVEVEALLFTDPLFVDESRA